MNARRGAKRGGWGWIAIILLAASAVTYLFVSRRGRTTPETGVPGTASEPGMSARPPLPTADDLRRGFRDSRQPAATREVRYFHDVDLNTASLAEIATLPGITPAYAEQIVAGRPYRAMSELERAGIPRAIVDEISPPAIIRLEDRGGPVAIPTPRPAPPRPPQNATPR